VTRRLFRSGESEYLINNVSCRLKDIQEVFMDTGLGNKAYSIIGQGQIGTIIEQKPEETRVMLEEAAGITKYRKKVEASQRKIELTETNLRRVEDILGEVERPGIYTLDIGGNPSLTEAAVASSGLPTLVDAIQKAGGITLRSDLSEVQLQRRIPSQGEQRFKRTRVNLLALITEGDLRQNPLLFDGDVIRLQRATQAIEPLATELGATTLAPQDITVNVVGEVNSPGNVSVPANTPLMKAILAAGDVSRRRAKKSDIELVRLNRNGTVTRRSYELDYNLGVSPERNPPLVDGDTIIVNRSRYAVSTDAINAVAQPLSGLVNVLTLFRLLGDD
jgi:polysaccharide export outer membrane protein